MTAAMKALSPRGFRRHRPTAIIDIGSNSIRLVIYDAGVRGPVPLFNEKAVCALGVGIGSTGRLSKDGVPAALASVGRFVRLARAMEAERIDILATAAVRDAADGKQFVETIERRYRVQVNILSGADEAQLSAMGVLCGVPDADGLVADLGGGSLELVTVQNGSFGNFATMPLGVLRLNEAAEGNRDLASSIIEGHLREHSWLKETKGRAVYAVGGAWRAIARVCIAQTEHPLLVLDNFTLEHGEAERLVDLISRQSRKSLEKLPGVSKRRLASLPMAALLLEKVLEAVQPSRLIFSVYGMREGQFYKLLPPKLRKQDPLLSACLEMARSAGRFPEHVDELMAWMAPLFPRETEPQRRLRTAACLLGDIFWSEHPDYRAEQAFLRVLRLPFLGLGHRDRAALALAVFVRYQGDEDNPQAMRARTLLDDESARHSRVIGLALRLSATISGGAPDLLRLTRLKVEKDRLVLEVPAKDPAFTPDLVDRQFDRLAKAMGFEALEIRLIK